MTSLIFKDSIQIKARASTVFTLLSQPEFIQKHMKVSCKNKGLHSYFGVKDYDKSSIEYIIKKRTKFSRITGIICDSQNDKNGVAHFEWNISSIKLSADTEWTQASLNVYSPKSGLSPNFKTKVAGIFTAGLLSISASKSAFANPGALNQIIYGTNIFKKNVFSQNFFSYIIFSFILSTVLTIDTAGIDTAGLDAAGLGAAGLGAADAVSEGLTKLDPSKDTNSVNFNSGVDPDVEDPFASGMGGDTPIVINFCTDIPNVFYNWGAVHTTTYFDLDSDGFDEPMWIWPDGKCNAILSVDLNQNGIIDNGNEIFNSAHTDYSNAFSLFEKHGYDDVYLWFDRPHFNEELKLSMYGTTEKDELKTLEEMNISHVDFDKVIHLSTDHYIYEDFSISKNTKDDTESKKGTPRVFAYCESCIMLFDGTTKTAFDVKFDYNNLIGLPEDRTKVTFLKFDQIKYTAQTDGEFIIGNHLDNVIDVGSKKDVYVFGNAGRDHIDCGLYETNVCFGGYGKDTISGLGTKVFGQQKG